MDELCEQGACTSCGGAVAWARVEPEPWRLFEAEREHDCPAGGYSPRRGPRRGRGKRSEGGRCTSCGGAVAWATVQPGRRRLFDAEIEHDCPAGGYSPRRRPQPRHRPVKPSLRKLIDAAMASPNGPPPS